MKRVFVLLLAVIILFACGREEPETPEIPEVWESLDYNESCFYMEEFEEYLATLAPEDEVKVNVMIKSKSYDDLSVKQMIEEEYGIPVRIGNAVGNRDYELTDPFAKEYYIEVHADDSVPSFEENINEARREFYDAYEELRKEKRREYFKDIVAEMPFRNPVELENYSNNVNGYTATAEEICKLSWHERVFFISPWLETPVPPPDRVENGVAFTETYGDLQVNVTFDRSEYEYGDTVNMLVSVYNSGNESVIFAPIIETGNNKVGSPDYVSGFYYIYSGFYADGVYRHDISCCYGYEASTDDEKPVLTLLPGETMGKTYAFTPHKSYKFLGEPVEECAEWCIRTGFALYGEPENTEYEFEIPVPRAE